MCKCIEVLLIIRQLRLVGHLYVMADDRKASLKGDTVTRVPSSIDESSWQQTAPMKRQLNLESSRVGRGTFETQRKSLVEDRRRRRQYTSPSG